MNKPTIPDRINPFFETNEPGQVIQLFEGEAKLTQGDVELNGRLRISQYWSPTELFWEFTGKGGSGTVTFGDVKIDSPKMKCEGRVSSQSRHLLTGYIKNGIEIGSDHKLDKVTFHLANYPNLFSSVEHHEANGNKSIRWSEVKLFADGWQIVMQPYKNHSSLSRKSSTSQQPVLNGIGEIRRIDRSQFRKNDAKRLIEALRIFLSFAFAQWSPPMLVVGSNTVTDKSWQFWTDYHVEPYWASRGWLDEFHADDLGDAFPGFLDRWSNDNWREPIELAVSWFIESSSSSSSIDGAIAYGQIPLEMLAWMKFVDDKEIVRKSEFDKLSAASKLQMLLANCGVPFEVPAELQELSTLSSKTSLTGPQLAVEVRNTTIHPSKSNREKLVGWEDKHGVVAQEIRWQTVLLFREYLTLVLLNEFGYCGRYASRLKSFPIAESKPVPWVADTAVYKIGKFVRDQFEKLFDEQKFGSTELDDLCNAGYSKRVFGLNYPLLKRSSNLEDRLDENGHARYYSRVYGGGYLLCSQWYERNREMFEKWLATKTETEDA